MTLLSPVRGPKILFALIKRRITAKTTMPYFPIDDEAVDERRYIGSLDFKGQPLPTLDFKLEMVDIARPLNHSLDDGGKPDLQGLLGRG